jgi:hypothetical protein
MHLSHRLSTISHPPPLGTLSPSSRSSSSRLTDNISPPSRRAPAPRISAISPHLDGLSRIASRHSHARLRLPQWLCLEHPRPAGHRS